MENKSLSEQICELCGVQPLFLCKIHSETKCETVYPNFENAENFKKLFNLKYGRSSWETVAYRLMKCPYQIKDTTEFLEKFLNMLKYHECWDIERIIETVKKTEWVI